MDNTTVTTKPSEYVTHDVYVGEGYDCAFLVIGDKIIKVRETSARTVRRISGIAPVNHWYWQNYLSLELIQAIYRVLDNKATKDKSVIHLQDHRFPF